MRDWIKLARIFKELEKCWKNLDDGRDTFKNYFKHRVSSSLSEGMNNVIKTIKKRAYEYRNIANLWISELKVAPNGISMTST